MSTTNTLLLIVLLGISTAAQAQRLFRGIVVDSATFAALPDVNVQVKGQYRGTISDARGNFSILAIEQDTLLLTRVGYYRLEFSLAGYEEGLIRLTEKETLLEAVTIHDSRLYTNPYEGLFDEERAKLKRKIPFYYSKARKDQVKAANWRDEAALVQTYVNVVINDPATKASLMKDHALTEQKYYEILTAFNEKHYTVMYFLTEAELRSLLNRFFELYPR